MAITIDIPAWQDISNSSKYDQKEPKKGILTTRILGGGSLSYHFVGLQKSYQIKQDAGAPPSIYALLLK